MHSELAIEKYNKKQSMEKSSFYSNIKIIANESLFYFGLFLTALFLLQKLPYWTGIINDLELGVTEVVVAFIGYLNVLFFQVTKKIFHKS